MSALRFASLLLILAVCQLIRADVLSANSAFQEIPSFLSNPDFVMIDQYLRSNHPSELSNAAAIQAEKQASGQHYRIMYSANRTIYAALVSRSYLSQPSSITEITFQATPVSSSSPKALYDHVMVGGYKLLESIPNTKDFTLVDQYVRDLKSEELRDATIISVATQIVSGINYRIRYRTPNNKIYQATVYRPLNSNLTSLTSFEVDNSAVLANDQRVGAYRDITNTDDPILASMDGLARSRYSSQLLNAKLSNAQVQTVAGQNYKLTYTTPVAKFQIVLFYQPWITTPTISNLRMLEYKGMPIVSSADAFLPWDTFKTDVDGKTVDLAIRNRYSNAQFVSAFRTLNGLDFRVNYIIDGISKTFELRAVEAALKTTNKSPIAIENSPAIMANPSNKNRRRLLQQTTSSSSSTSSGNIPNFQSDSRFVVVDRYLRQLVSSLNGTTATSFSVQNTDKGANYKVVYRTPNGTSMDLTVKSQSLTAAGFQVPAGPVQTSTTSKTTTTTTSSSSSANSQSFTNLQGFFSNPIFVSANSRVISQLPDFNGAQPVSVQSLTNGNSNTYRIVYRLTNGVYRTVTVVYSTANGSAQIVSNVNGVSANTGFVIPSPPTTVTSNTFTSNTNSIPTSSFTNTTITTSFSQKFTPIANPSSNPDIIRIQQSLFIQRPNLSSNKLYEASSLQNADGSTSYNLTYLNSNGSGFTSFNIIDRKPVTQTRTTTTITNNVVPGFVNTNLVNNVRPPVLNSTTTTNTTLSAPSNTLADNEIYVSNFQSNPQVIQLKNQIKAQYPTMDQLISVSLINGTSFKLRFLTTTKQFKDVQKVVTSPTVTIDNITASPSVVDLSTPDGFSVFVGYVNDSNFKVIDQNIRNNNRNLDGATVRITWTRKNPDGSISYRIRYLTADKKKEFETTVTVSSVNGQTRYTQDPAPVVTTSTTVTVQPQGYVQIINFRNNQDVSVINSLIRQQIGNPILELVAAWSNRDNPNNTLYRLQYLLPDGSRIQSIVSRSTVTNALTVVETRTIKSSIIVPQQPVSTISTVTTTNNNVNPVSGGQNTSFTQNNGGQQQPGFSNNVIQKNQTVVNTIFDPNQQPANVPVSGPIGATFTGSNVTVNTVVTTTNLSTVTKPNTPSVNTNFNPNVNPNINPNPVPVPAFIPSTTNNSTTTTTVITTNYSNNPGQGQNPQTPNFPNFSNQNHQNSNTTSTNTSTTVTNTSNVKNNGYTLPSWELPAYVVPDWSFAIPNKSLNVSNTTTTTTVVTTNSSQIAANTTPIVIVTPAPAPFPAPTPTPVVPIYTPPVVVPTPVTPTIVTIPTQAPAPAPPQTPTQISFNLTLPTLTTTTTIDNNTYTLITDYLSRIEFASYDTYARSRLPQLANARISYVWIITGPSGGGYKIQYVTDSGIIIDVIVLKGFNNQYVLTTEGNNNQVNTTTTTNTVNTTYQTLENYGGDVNFKRIDELARSILLQGSNATVVSVWIQFTSNGTNYRIQYRLPNGTQVQITIWRSISGDKLNIVDQSVVQTNNSSNNSSNSNNSTSSSTTTTTVDSNSTTSNVFQSFNDWQTNTNFLNADRYIRSQNPDLRNAQIVSVWWIQVPNGYSYKITYNNNGVIIEVVIIDINSGSFYNITSYNTSNNFRRLSNYADDQEFSFADQFARAQMPQLQSANINDVWVSYFNGLNYKVEYMSSNSVTITVIVTYNSFTDTYDFQLLSPLSYTNFIAKADQLCIATRRGRCIQCNSRSFLQNNNRCQMVSASCRTFNPNTGICITCNYEYTFYNDDCVLTASLMPPNCISFNYGRCTSCISGYSVVNGQCAFRDIACQITRQDGRCLSCAVGYLLIDFVCLRS